MGFLDRVRRTARGRVDGSTIAYLREWMSARRGVEAFVEPRTTVTDVTVVLVAHDGEWTRRVVGERGAQRLSRDLGIPVYDVRLVGYPQRMRDHDARRRIERRRARLAEDGVDGG
ncbi:oxidoreductase [Nocardia uniformis]|uniref:Oxidoreductase n=1 Tax=Nocardia uniformis TaxID=53432 RepID=A0A849C165_9NOCA|nr:oxidoreductase [Nocardia uniformis]NNH72364.1 oxidoreductase [Nocardia uniformis]